MDVAEFRELFQTKSTKERSVRYELYSVQSDHFKSDCHNWTIWLISRGSLFHERHLTEKKQLVCVT